MILGRVSNLEKQLNTFRRMNKAKINYQIGWARSKTRLGSKSLSLTQSHPRNCRSIGYKLKMFSPDKPTVPTRHHSFIVWPHSNKATAQCCVKNVTPNSFQMVFV